MKVFSSNIPLARPSGEKIPTHSCSKNAPTLQFVRSPICVCTSNWCDLMAVNLGDGHLFRTTNKTAVSTSPFIGFAVANRLVQHLKTLGIHNGESMHSFRSGCSITLSLLGVSSEEVARHIGWRSLDTAEYYTQTKKVMNMSNTASVLASSTAVTPSGAVASASSVA